MIELLISLIGDGKEGEDEDVRNAKAILSVFIALIVIAVIVAAIVFAG